MKKVFRLSITLDDARASSMPSQNDLFSAVKALLSGDGAEVDLVELHAAAVSPSPIKKSSVSGKEPELRGSSYRACNTEKLLELISTDPLCDAYKDAARRSKIDPNGQHLLQMVLPFVNVEASREILVHRVEVNVKMTGTMVPWRFLIEITSKRWDRLRDVAPVGD